MTQARVLLLDLPRILHDLTAELLAGEPSIGVVEAAEGGDLDIAAIARAAGATLVICGTHRREPPEGFMRLVHDTAALPALALTADGRRTSLYLPLGELTPKGLLEAIRTASA